jgi:hypothetical protein
MEDSTVPAKTKDDGFDGRWNDDGTTIDVRQGPSRAGADDGAAEGAA